MSVIDDVVQEFILPYFAFALTGSAFHMRSVMGAVKTYTNKRLHRNSMAVLPQDPVRIPSENVLSRICCRLLVPPKAN